MKEENMKQLKMALMNHKNLKLDLGDNQELILKWEDEISNYRGYSEKLDVEIGIWDLKYLLEIANGKTEYNLYIC